MKTHFLNAVALLAVATLTASCGGDDSSPVAVAPPPPPPVTVAPPPPPAQGGLSLSKCLNQDVGGRKLVDILVPDQVVLDLNKPSGFPNGRDFDDPVVDIELAALFLDLTRHPADTFVNVPVNPNNFDQPLRTTFPFYAAPLGTPTLSPTTGTNFNFRTDPVGSYVRVDRMGMPAVATVAILGPRKNAYNDSNPANDAAGTSVPDILAGYQALTDALNDDIKGLGLTPCAT